MYSTVASPTSPDDVSMTDLNAILTVRSAQDKQSSVQLGAFDSSIEWPLPPPPPSPPQPLMVLQHHKQPSTKSTHTLRSNIDTKNETNKKRTSLKLDNGVDLAAENGEPVRTTTTVTKQSAQHQRLATVKRCSRNLDNAKYRIEANAVNNNNGEYSDSNTNTSSGVGVGGGGNGTRTSSSGSSGTSSARSNSGSDGDTEENGNGTNVNAKHDADGNHRKMRRPKQKSSGRNANGRAADANQLDNVIDNDNDHSDCTNGTHDIRMHNGGSSSDNSTQKRDSVTSKASSDDYFLCEKFKNTLNAQLSDAVVGGHRDNVMHMELMSPHEGPFGRRYAEIAPMKNAINNDNNIVTKW